MSEPLAGGGSGPVVRVGDTVRRVAGPWTPQVAALLHGLRAAGVAVAPEHLLDLPASGWRREAAEPVEVLCHGDVAPYNAVFRDGRLVAFIDWDYAGPGPRLWDLGHAAYRFVSLTAPTNADGRPGSAAEQWRRVGVLCAAYGDVDPVEVVAWAATWLADHMAYSRARAAAGDPVFLATIAAGDVGLYETDLGHLDRLLAEGPTGVV